MVKNFFWITLRVLIITGISWLFSTLFAINILYLLVGLFSIDHLLRHLAHYLDSRKDF